MKINIFSSQYTEITAGWFHFALNNSTKQSEPSHYAHSSASLSVDLLSVPTSRCDVDRLNGFAEWRHLPVDVTWSV